MKNGKIVLGAVAAIVTVTGALAFKASHRFSSHLVYGVTRVNGNLFYQCASLWTNVVSGGHATKCFTQAGNAGLTLKGLGSNHRTFYTQTNGSGGANPGSQVTKVTVSQ